MNEMTGLHEERLDKVCSTLKASGARRVLDLGCGAGALLYRLLAEPQFERVVGLEQSLLRLGEARQMLAGHLNGDRPRLQLLAGSYTEPNDLLTGFDAAAMVETIEHVPPAMLSLVEDIVFGQYRPQVLFMTTPNREYNPLFNMAPNEMREPDHKFEWDRMKFRRWAKGVADRQGYEVVFGGIGEYHPEAGQPTQTALFSLQEKMIA
ncbi:MAG: methyltransferase domain-containing protein [Alcanivoracaceae bacterium]|nr:methyltransferase domain-containing protein [Alcanivoracaceae bacterium]